jgi:hypothetical protein
MKNNAVVERVNIQEPSPDGPVEHSYNMESKEKADQFEKWAKDYGRDKGWIVKRINSKS